jgi:hypothetical protein
MNECLRLHTGVSYGKRGVRVGKPGYYASHQRRRLNVAHGVDVLTVATVAP